MKNFKKIVSITLSTLTICSPAFPVISNGKTSLLNLSANVSAAKTPQNLPMPWEDDDFCQQAANIIKAYYNSAIAGDTEIANEDLTTLLGLGANSLNSEENWNKIRGLAHNTSISMPSHGGNILSNLFSNSFNNFHHTIYSNLFKRYIIHLQSKYKIPLKNLKNNSELNYIASMFNISPDDCENIIKGDLVDALSEKAYTLATGASIALILFCFGPMKNLISTSYNTLKTSASFMYNNFIYNRLKIESDPAKMLELLDSGLNDVIIGQNNAINQISNEIIGWLHLRKNNKQIGSCLITLLGASGTGKTFAAREISKIVFGKDMQSWQFVTSSAIKSDNSIKSDIPADQIFNTKSELVRQLEKNPEVVIVLDEVDKMYTNDKNQTVLERLRDAKDTGKLLVRTNNGNYKFIDVSHTIFILTSNERVECWGLPERELTPAYSKSRTVVNRDLSLTNRFKVIEFKEFEMPTFKIILTPLIDFFIESVYNEQGINI